MPHFQQGAKVIGKKALQTGVNVAQDIPDVDNLKTAVLKQAKQTLVNVTSQKSQQAQSGAGWKGRKRKAEGSGISSPPSKKAKASSQAKKPKKGNLTYFFLCSSRVTQCTKSELDLFTIPATQASIHKGQWIEYHPLTNITDTGPIELNVSATGKEYLDLAGTQLYVKA